MESPHPCCHPVRIRRTANGLADALGDPTLLALLEQRPIVALVLLAHPDDDVEVHDGGIAVTRPGPRQHGTLTITTAGPTLGTSTSWAELWAVGAVVGRGRSQDAGVTVSGVRI